MICLCLYIIEGTKIEDLNTLNDIVHKVQTDMEIPCKILEFEEEGPFLGIPEKDRGELKLILEIAGHKVMNNYIYTQKYS